MLKRLQSLFESHMDPAADNSSGVDTGTIEFAAAVLMMEISRADSSVDHDERAIIDAALVDHFHLPPQEAKELLELVEQEADHLISLHEFTRLINDRLSREDRVKIVELLWRVAFADAVLDKYEEYFVRKIADLLYVSHKDYIRTKHLASGEAQD